MGERLREILRRWGTYFALTDHSILLAMAGVVGLFSAAGTILFVRLLHGTHHLLRDEFLAHWNYNPWLIPLIPAIGALGAGLVIDLWAKESRGHGVPNVIKAVALNDGQMRPRIAVVTTIASAFTIGSGGSAGQEGPMVQIGAVTGSWFAQALRYGADRTRILVACGAAAGISATFNAPFAGVFFALEVILEEFRLESFSPVVIASVISNIVIHEAWGAEPVFQIPAYTLVHVVEIPLYVLLGIVCGVVGVNFGKTLTLAEEWSENFPAPEWLKPALAGLILGCITLLAGNQIMGNGYETVGAVMRGMIGWQWLVALVLLKTLGTDLTLGSGACGGIFAPALFMGACAGGAFGHGVHALLGSYTAPSGAYAVVGMAGVVAAAIHAPLTGVLLVFEMTGSYDMILPVMLATVAGTLFARRVDRNSIFHMKLVREGIQLRSGRDVMVLENMHVRDVMHSDVITVRDDAPLGTILEKIQTTSHSSFPVLNKNGEYVGMLSFDSVRGALTDVELRMLLIAAEFVDSDFLTTTPAEDLHTVLDKFERQQSSHLPVVSADDSHRLVGIVTRADVIFAYNKEVAKRRLIGQTLL